VLKIFKETLDCCTFNFLISLFGYIYIAREKKKGQWVDIDKCPQEDFNQIWLQVKEESF
jgi:hypothetical protein